VSEPQPKSLTEPFRSLADVEILLDSRINYETDRMVHCVEALGRPDRTFRTIHVTGTKGKSV